MQNFDIYFAGRIIESTNYIKDQRSAQKFAEARFSKSATGSVQAVATKASQADHDAAKARSLVPSKSQKQ